MKSQKNLLSLSFAAILFANVAYCATYYVDNSGSPTCSNSSSYGTEANPWCTITYGIAHISGGDNLYVKAGTYHEDVYIAGPAGDVNKDTLIKAYPGVTLYGSGVDSGRVMLTNTSHITLDGFAITNFNQGLFVVSASYITVQNCSVYNVGQEGIHIKFDSSYVTVQNCTIHDTRAWKYNGEGIYVGTASSQTPLDNTHHVTIRNNIIYNTNDECIELKPGTHDSIIEGNILYNCLTDPDITQTWWGSIEVNPAVNTNQHWNSNPNHIVRNNIIHNTKTGIRAGTGSLIYNNLIYNINSSYKGIYVDNKAGDSYTRKIYHNTVDLPSDRAVVVASGMVDIKNNIGPDTINNLSTSNNYYVNKASTNYRLATGTAPINAGVDLTSIVSTDLEGNLRTFPTDLGAYEK
jgi:parallel beta-helix repeat protein